MLAGTAAAAGLLGAGWLLGRHGAAPPVPAPHDGIAVVAATGRADPRATAPMAAAASPAPVTGNTPATLPKDADVKGALPDPLMEAAALYRRIRAEPIDAALAATSQRAIDAVLVKVPYLDREALRVRCATTLCEVHGRTMRDASGECGCRDPGAAG